MTSVKVVLRKKANRDGAFPIALRITKDRKSSFVHIGHAVQEKDWDAAAQRVRKSHPNSARLNNFIMKKLSEATDTALEVDTQQNEASSATIKRKIKPTASELFFARADQSMQRLKESGNFNRWRADASRLRVFKEFLFGTDAIWDELSLRARSLRETPVQGAMSGTEIPFQRIDIDLLTRFKIYLKARRGVSDRTIANVLLTIQGIFTQAIREGALDRKHCPFGRDKIKIKIPESLKVGLTKEDIEKLETVEFAVAAHGVARDIWLVSFYFAGMRAADVLQLRWRDFQDGRLHYVMGKNKKIVSLKVPEKAARILECYAPMKEGPDSFVFPYMKGWEHVEDEFTLKERIAAAIGLCNKMLKGHVAPAARIEGKISMHISRHSFATLAADKIPIQQLQKLYRHSDIKTTIGYQSAFMHKDADDALDAVLGGRII